MSDFIPKIPNKWATPKDFDGQGRDVTIVDFEVLSLQDIESRDGRLPLYPPDPAKNSDHDGMIRRLTFIDHELGDMQRTIDTNSKRFQNDLAGKIKAKGVRGRLLRQHGGKRFAWNFIPQQ